MAAPPGSVSTLISRENIRVAAETVGVELAEDVVKTLCQEVEYRLREITQEAIKFMKHGKRDKLTPVDINNALKLRNVEMIYGYGSRETMEFKKTTAGNESLFFTEEKELSLEEIVTQTRLPPLPLQPTYTVHWLSVDGVQPEIPQNPAKSLKRALGGGSNAKTDNLILEEAEVKPTIRHVLSKELQEYYEKLVDSILNGESNALRAAFGAMSSDPGLHQLMPYFCQFIAKQVADNLQNLSILTRIINMVHCILINPHIHVDHYLHNLIPAVLTCLVGKRLCDSPTENHWQLRDHASELVALICHRWGREYATIQPRIVKTLVHAFLDVKRPLTTHYGAIVGLSRLGPQTRQLLLLPNLDRYFRYLIPAMEQIDNTIKRNEAHMVYHALLASAGQFLLDSAKSYSHAEQILVQSASSSLKRPLKLARGPDGKPQAPLQDSLRAIELDDLVPLSTRYSHLYDLFGDSIFPYITRRPDDLAFSLIL
jgi:transcription initiation factor TFIID subunit 6